MSTMSAEMGRLINQTLGGDDTSGHKEDTETKGNESAVNVDQKSEQDTDTDTLQKQKSIAKRATDGRINTWLACDFRLDDISNKEQNFKITGWINCVWMEPMDTMLHRAILHYKEHFANSKNVWCYDNEIRMRVLDLRNADRISYYLPIDARRIFYQPSLKGIEHIDPPYLIFNTNTNMVWTEYYVRVTLSEHLELKWFPFDKQFLNIKLRWNKMYYRILDWIKEEDRKIPLDGEWFGDPSKDPKGVQRNLDSYYYSPLENHVVEELDYDITMEEPWVDFSFVEDAKSTGFRFALIRLRFRRNPAYYFTYILFPFFVIILCGFSTYAIPPSDISGRLRVSVTVLLTFTAFQNIITSNLPATCEMEWIDWYITLSYLVQALIICGVIIASLGEYNGDWNIIDEERAMFIDMLCGSALFALWFIGSVLYVGIGVYQQNAHTDSFWEKRAKDEIDAWDKQRIKPVNRQFWMVSKNLERRDHFKHKCLSKDNDDWK